MIRRQRILNSLKGQPEAGSGNPLAGRELQSALLRLTPAKVGDIFPLSSWPVELPATLIQRLQLFGCASSRRVSQRPDEKAATASSGPAFFCAVAARLCGCRISDLRFQIHEP